MRSSRRISQYSLHALKCITPISRFPAQYSDTARKRKATTSSSAESLALAKAEILDRVVARTPFCLEAKYCFSASGNSASSPEARSRRWYALNNNTMVSKHH
ncbi:hypothetical protein PV05_04048 [Exophiala xenobiotica]|uniref:Uncharacterized protein n=1 Tax=Exophiala xenobiotica TaxID=348802 RepID=A0A0D2C448_9EURO|nr:uncharacterized protein PV05_04048 [Exophiala xenobiotica]KIW59611.1 hypothetical protein PV05_04048 [Exophiala xenobiotica]